MDRFFAILCDGVHRFEGTVDKFTGDGIMALFGAPVAHEDHAQRACCAALALRDELASYAAELRRTAGLSFSVRMGLNSGEVVVGAIGDDLRSRIHRASATRSALPSAWSRSRSPAGLYITEHTAEARRLDISASMISASSMSRARAGRSGCFALGGGGRRAVAPRHLARARLHAVRRTRATRWLCSRPRSSRLAAGAAQVVVGVVGEAGVGKSRLCHEFAERCRRRGIPVYEAQGQAHGRAIPFLPVLQYMRSYFDIAEHDYDQSAREKIAGRLLLLDEAFTESLPLVFDFLAVRRPQSPGAADGP